MHDKKMPEEWWHSLSWKTHLPNSQLISLPEQQHHISSSRTSLSQTLHVFILCQTEREECVPKTCSTICQQHTSVLGIIQNALGCWLCLTFNLSTGEQLWKDRKILMGPAEDCHLVYLWTGVEGKGEQRKSQRSAVFHFHSLWYDRILALRVFCCLG